MLPALCLILIFVFNAYASCESASLGYREVTPAQLECFHRLPILEAPFCFMLPARFSGFVATNSSTLALSGLGRFSLRRTPYGGWSAAHCFRSTPLALIVDAAMGASWPRVVYVRLMISLSMSSRVLLHSSSTSAGVRPVVGIGSSTANILSPAHAHNYGGNLTHLCRGSCPT